MKKTCGLLLTALLFVVFGATLHAQSSEAAIRQVLTDQQTAWNSGDIVAFMRGYDDSPQTTFIGKTIQRGFQVILARYQKNYANRDAMGQLTFSEIDVRMLGEDHAVATGHYHLTRTDAGGGDASGIYSLVFEKKAGGWKIVLDHTST